MAATAALHKMPDPTCPVGLPSNDNSPGRRKVSWPLREMYSRGELGISVLENRRHWHAAQRFADVYSAAHDQEEEFDWRAVMLELTELNEELVIQQLGPNDGPMELNDDGEFVDNGTAKMPEVVDYAGFNPHRDIPAPLLGVRAKEVVALAADVLGVLYPLLVAVIVKRWTMQMVGETEGIRDRAGASACGKGMTRQALRELSAFFVKLDRLEAGEGRVGTAWPLVGTPMWRFADEPGPWRSKAA